MAGQSQHVHVFMTCAVQCCALRCGTPRRGWGIGGRPLIRGRTCQTGNPCGHGGAMCVVENVAESAAMQLLLRGRVDPSGSSLLAARRGLPRCAAVAARRAGLQESHELPGQVGPQLIVQAAVHVPPTCAAGMQRAAPGEQGMAGLPVSPTVHQAVHTTEHSITEHMVISPDCSQSLS